jgi:hypothetical protein
MGVGHHGHHGDGMMKSHGDDMMKSSGEGQN